MQENTVVQGGEGALLRALANTWQYLLKFLRSMLFHLYHEAYSCAFASCLFSRLLPYQGIVHWSRTASMRVELKVAVKPLCFCFELFSF